LGKNFTIDYEIISSFKLKLVGTEPKNAKQNFTMEDKEGYIYFGNLSDMKQKLKQNHSLSRFHTSNSHTIDNIKLWCKLNSVELELVSTIYLNNKQKLVFKDKEGYYYLLSLDCLRRNSTASRFHKSNSYTIQNIKLWCNLNNKPFKLISKIYVGADDKLEWQCLKDGCGEIFKMKWSHIYDNHGCGFCHGKQIGLSNCLETLRFKLSKEWHPIKNGDLTPFDVTVSNGEYAWWSCKKCNHEWEAVIASRSSGIGCPRCAEINAESHLQKRTRLYINECGYDVLHEKECTLNPKNIINPPVNIISNKQRRKGILRYDNEIIIDNRHLFIEVNGQQHDLEDNIFNIKSSKKHNTTPKEELEYLKARDKFKEQYVHMQGENYYYLVLWYYDFDKEDTYKKLIDDKINEVLSNLPLPKAI